MLPSGPFEPYHDPGPRFAGMAARSVYITVHDGTRLAADIYLPHPLPSGERLPTLLYQTRYWRSTELRPPLSWLIRGPGDHIPFSRKSKSFYVRRGYALVVVDVRGTGASFGVSRHPWEAVTVQDSAYILDWITAQPWSDGQVAGIGVSYLGTTAELLLATRHPALKAVIPQFNHPDSFTDIGMPGGLLNARFISAWAELNAAQDNNSYPSALGAARLLMRGVQPVSGPSGREDLAEAVKMHAANAGINELEMQVRFRDERHPVGGYSMNDQTVMRFRAALEAHNVPVYGWASWMDAGTGQAALRRWMTFSGPQMVVIGAWNHGGMQQSSPYRPAQTKLSPPTEIQQREIMRFLDVAMKGDPADIKRVIYYYTLGFEVWQHTTIWPPAGIERERWYLGPGCTLVRKPFEKVAGSNGGQPDPGDRYAVNFQASTGTYNRWWELGVIKRRPVDYGDRAAQKPYLLGYESTLLEHDVEITGSPVVTLHVSSTEPDCAFYVYLEDVFPDGHIVYLTEGQLRSIHRKVCPASDSPYTLDIPYHSFCKEDAMPMVTGEITEITFGLLPVSARIEAGHRLRVSIAGHDEGTFPRIPAQGDPVWVIYRSDRYPSAIDIPMKVLSQPV